jgi:hypothetical protein
MTALPSNKRGIESRTVAGYAQNKMSRNSASTIATGGAGYTFADKVAAAFLVQMLQRGFPFESELGIIAEVHFETRESGNVLDDLQLVLRSGNEVINCTASVKSNRQLSKAGFNSEFVKDAWEQWRGAAGSKFNSATDILCLITGVVDDQALQTWRELQKQARATTPERLVERLADGIQFSAIQRAIFKSLGNPQGGSDVDTALIASRVRLLHFSEDKEGDYINRCAEVVLDGTQIQGANLWSRLLQLASENRATGGYFDLPKLIRVLRAGFELRDFPDYRADWERLARISSENIEAVRTVVGSDIHLIRQQEKNALAARMTEHPVVALAGESGTGKSALLTESLGVFKRVLWLSAAQLSKPSQAELAIAFGLTYDIPTLIGHSTLQDCALVLDGFEHLEGEARDRAIQLLRSLKDQDFTGWKLVITCQPQVWGSVQDVLLQTGINDFDRLDISKPAAGEILAAVRHLPAIRGLLLRTDLQPFLCNLVVLDWVLRGDIAQRLSLAQARIGETDVIQRIWERWIGETDMRFARDNLLRLIGQGEGEKLSGAVHIDAIPRDQLPLLGGLAGEGLLRVTAPSVQFAHDLMGDWARFRILTFAGKAAPTSITDLAHIPRWNRAIRLYAQSLVEQGSGLDRWKTAIKEIGGEAPEARLASDLFLDGLLFAANSQLLLQQVWQHLVADDGQILRRLLKRLVHVASFPDWRLQLVAEAKDADQMAAWFRVPLPLYWYPALLVLSGHAEDVTKHALIPAAEACALWLRTMPPEMPGRREAALLAVSLGKETQDLIAEGLHFGGKDKVVYEALLLAGRDLPDEVMQIALELAGRRDEPDHAIQRALEAQERQAKLSEEWAKKHPERARVRHAPPIMPSRVDGPIRPPDPDGPLREVGDGFRSAVLDTPALSGLIGARPEAAKELLLAVCIDEPKPVELHRSPLPLDGLGLSHWQHGYPAMYWKGPFWKFLQDAPEQALDAIVRLVNYATRRSLEDHVGPLTAEQRQEYALEFEIAGKPIYWLGDCNVFGWHRSLSIHGEAVECALMALEKWLYDEIELGHEITRWVDHIFSHAESLAFAGVLVAVGLKYPGLFLRELMPMLGNYDLYHCQSSWAVSERSESWAIALSNQGQEVVKMGVEWNRMPHRRAFLRDVSYLMPQHEGLREYLMQRAAEWAKRLERSRNEKQRDDLRFFLARFDPRNYTETPQPDGQVLIEMHWPADLEAKAQESQEKSSLGMLTITLASQARAYLSGRSTLSPEELPKFAAQVQRLASAPSNDTDPAQRRYRKDSIAGGIAVLVVEHRQWLAQNPELEKWCLQTLRDLEPEDRELDTPLSAMDQSVESFRGEAGAALLQESGEEWVLRMAFDGITAFYYNATFQTVWRAYLLREQLGERFDELVNVVVLWSALRRGANRESGHEANRALLTKYKDTLFKRLAKGKLRKGFIPLRKAETLGHALVDRISRRSMSAGERRAREEHRRTVREDRRDRKLYREIPDLDFEVLQKGFGFMAGMSREPLPADEQRLGTYVREICDMEMRTLPRPASGEERYEISGTPYEFDGWVMRRVVEFMVHKNSVEVARTFYRPIIELGPAARYWVRDFLQAWIVTGLEMTSDRRTFADIWREIVEYAMGLPAWQCGEPGYWCPAEPLAADLMGLQQAPASVLGQAKYRELVIMMAPVYEKWGSQWLKFGSVAAWFAHFLPTESGRVLLGRGIKQLAEALPSFQDRDWHQHSLGPLLTDALAACWSYVRQDVESQPDLKKAFLSMLTVLCARQIPEAIHLRNKVSETLVRA